LKKWDEKEKRKQILDRFLLKKGQLKEILADCYAFRILFKCFPLDSMLDIQEICEKAHEIFGFPQGKKDTDQIEKYIFLELKKIGWKI